MTKAKKIHPVLTMGQVESIAITMNEIIGDSVKYGDSIESRNAEMKAVWDRYPGLSDFQKKRVFYKMHTGSGEGVMLTEMQEMMEYFGVRKVSFNQRGILIPPRYIV